MSIEIILVAIFANLGITNKPEIKFFTELFELLFSIQGRVNFENLSRYSPYDESTFRRRYSQFFDWLGFNNALIHCAKVGSSGCVIGAVDCSFIPKSGKHTFGLDKFWSSCAGNAKKGLEISVLALIDVATANAWTLDVTQTPPQLKTKGEGDYTRLDFYIEQILDCLPQLKMVKYFVADGFYAKVKFIKALLSVNKHLITKLRPDANLKFKFEGQHVQKRGAKPKYEGKAVYNDLSKWHFKGKDAKYPYLNIYHRICYSPQFDCWLSVALVINTKTHKYILLASTDLEQDPLQILTFYQLRFQIEFLFRDAKQFTGLNHCQARDEQKLDFHFNLALSALNLIQILKLNDPTITSMNALTRKAYNTRIVQVLLKQLSLDAEFDIFHPKVVNAINFGAIF
jgi:DDE superfamily endonuclease